jgi:hypothetical protein
MNQEDRCRENRNSPKQEYKDHTLCGSRAPLRYDYVLTHREECQPGREAGPGGTENKAQERIATEQSRRQEVIRTEPSKDVAEPANVSLDEYHGKLRKLDNRHDDSPGFYTR